MKNTKSHNQESALFGCENSASEVNKLSISNQPDQNHAASSTESPRNQQNIKTKSKHTEINADLRESFQGDDVSGNEVARLESKCNEAFKN